MATKYSSLYGQNPSDSTNYIYKGPTPEGVGKLCIRRATFTGTMAAASSDKLKLFKAVAGERLVHFANNRSGDPDAANDATVNIGWTSAPTAVASASTGMQAVAKLELTAGDLVLVAAAAEGDELEVAMAAGAMEVSATHTFVVISHVPA